MKVAYLDASGSEHSILGESFFEGTAVVYAAKGYASTCLQCDYELEPRFDTRKSEVRAVREAKRSRAEKPPLLPATRIRDQVVILFGPEMCPKEAIQTLQALIEKIKRQGLSIGFDEAGNSLIETVEGKKKQAVVRS